MFLSALRRHKNQWALSSGTAAVIPLLLFCGTELSFFRIPFDEVEPKAIVLHYHHK